MNPIICYVYEYKSGRKFQNMGFLKIQSGYHKILVQMHLRGLALTNSESLDFCIFYKENESAIFQKLLDLPVKNKSMNMQVSISEELFPENRTLRECDGFLFRGPYGDVYVATWMNVPFNPDKIQAYAKPVLDTVQSDAVSALRCRKIIRSELSTLPRRNWNLANNSFLLHGFYNFHHLLLIEEDDHFILGVPGFYDKKEARAADLFGFPIFSKDYLKEVNLSDEERSDHENFGYWCKTIHKLE